MDHAAYVRMRVDTREYLVSDESARRNKGLIHKIVATLVVTLFERYKLI